MHISYPKIMSLDKEECEWILCWEVYVQEKIDWANFSIWNDNWLCMWSRTQVVYSHWETQKPFRWAQDYVLKHEWIIKLLTDKPQYRLFWEYLCKHTIIYPEQHYNKFYMFDIMVWDVFFAIDDRQSIVNLWRSLWIFVLDVRQTDTIF